jgi:rhodanese-related sulfurtransferase
MDVPTVLVDQIPATAVLLDVREDVEWEAGHIEGAVHVPLNSIPATLAHDPGSLTPDASIVVVCAVGGRSAHVTAWLITQGL